MRENRSYGSEGGVSQRLIPTPITGCNVIHYTCGGAWLLVIAPYGLMERGLYAEIYSFLT